MDERRKVELVDERRKVELAKGEKGACVSDSWSEGGVVERKWGTTKDGGPRKELSPDEVG